MSRARVEPAASPAAPPRRDSASPAAPARASGGGSQPARILQYASLSFDISFLEMFTAWCSGGTLVLVGEELRRDVTALARLLVTQRVDAAILPVVVLQQLAEECLEGDVDLGSMRHLATSGEQLHVTPAVVRLLRRFPGIRFHNLYGPAETHVVTAHTLTGEPRSWPAHPPIGRPIASTQIYVLDRGAAPVGVGHPGEIYIGGVSLGRGYLGRPAMTAEAFVPDPWSETAGARLYRTGDQARVLPGGEVQFLGRLDLQVKIRGFRVELEEVEAVLGRHSAINQAVVVVPDAGGSSAGRRLVAYCVADDGGEGVPSAADLRAFLGARLPSYMVPGAFVACTELPLSPTGKIDRAALARRGVPAPSAALSEGGGATAPRTAVEQVLAAIWERLLERDDIAVDDDFFELGGHSLLATQVVARARQAFGVELPVRRLFEHPTVAELAECIDLARRQAGSETAVAPPLRPVARGGELPLSFAQQRLWFLHQLEAGSPAYNTLGAWHLEGGLDVAALERALGEISRRHEVLRTTFPAVLGRPHQRVAAAAAPRLATLDLTALPPGGARREARRRLSAAASQAFDLARDLPLRVLLLKLAEAEHALLVVVHHIAFDGWSQGVFRRELSALYAAFAAGAETSPLPQLEVQYADYAVWQRRWLRGETLEGHLAPWRRRLAGISNLELPADRPRRGEPVHSGAAEPLRADAGLTAALKRLGRDAGASLYMVVLAAFMVLLHRLTGQDDIVVGSPIANRGRTESEGLIGFFVNMLVLRADLAGSELSYLELLGRVRETALQAYDHQDLPFERLVEEVAPERDRGRHPLFQVSLALHNAPRPGLELAGLAATPMRREVEAGRLDLELHLWEQPAAGGGAAALAGTLVYRTGLFDAATAARWAGYFERLLGAVVAAPEAQVRDLAVESAAQRHQSLIEWNDSRATFPATVAPEECLHHLFENQAARTPERDAVVWEDPDSRSYRRLSYRRLNRRAERLARRLVARGVGPEVRVAIFLERGPELVVALVAVLKAGGAYVPLDSSYPPPRLALMLEDSHCELVVTRPELMPRLPDPQSGGPRPGVLLLTGAGAEKDSAPLPPRGGNSPAPGNLAYVLYTSGSSGRPKGVAISHAAIVNHMRWMQAALPLDGEDRVLQKTPLGFDASVWEFWAPLQVGACLVLARPDGHRDVAYLVRALGEQQVTVLQVVPALLRLLLEQPGFDRLSCLRRVLCGGEALAADLRERFLAALQAELYNVYGPAEATIHASFDACNGAAPGEVVAVGRAIANARLYLLDRHLRPVPPGVAGELHVAGAGLARGYLERPRRTAEKLIPDPFATPAGAGGRLFATGDRMRRLADGRLEFLGRCDHQVKIRGARVEPGDVESTLGQHPMVRAAAVVALLEVGGAGGLRLVAYVVPAPQVRDSGRALAARWRRFLAARLPSQMVPSAFVVLDRLPLSPSGKVDRRALPTPGDSRSASEETFVAPRTPAEETLARIWSEVLGAGRVGVRDNFFELGGHSLLAIQVVARVRHELRRELALRSLFDSPTVADLARHLEAAAPVGPSAVPEHPGGEMEEGSL